MQRRQVQNLTFILERGQGTCLLTKHTQCWAYSRYFFPICCLLRFAAFFAYLSHIQILSQITCQSPPSDPWVPTSPIAGTCPPNAKICMPNPAPEIEFGEQVQKGPFHDSCIVQIDDCSLIDFLTLCKLDLFVINWTLVPREITILVLCGSLPLPPLPLLLKVIQ